MNKVEGIWQNHSQKNDKGYIFSKCHVRKTALPLLDISLTNLVELLQPAAFGHVAINGMPVAGSFALSTAANKYFGLVQQGKIACLSTPEMDPNAHELQKIMETYDFIFVDWPSCRVLEINS